jgi:hypothetical protein
MVTTATYLLAAHRNYRRITYLTLAVFAAMC